VRVDLVAPVPSSERIFIDLLREPNQSEYGAGNERYDPKSGGDPSGSHVRRCHNQKGQDSREAECHRMSNDEVERRGASPASNEGTLSQSSTLSLAHRRRHPRSLEPIVRPNVCGTTALSSEFLSNYQFQARPYFCHCTHLYVNETKW